MTWWRSWSSTDPARRKGTCDDVQLGSWKREATRRTNWWRSWSSTDPARRKGTCDDVQLGSWKREATRRTNNHGKLKLGSYEAYDREIKAGACLRITKRRGWSIAQLQWNIFLSQLVQMTIIMTVVHINWLGKVSKVVRDWSAMARR
ncbi:hypothetical protein Bca52824_040522 [Brassica carinata]|uniref:Uncharacterized protein n=1 Tax=Brassica carinata TaxID=52824 RepID=A0A8X7RV04_BRACI|nr:hypothetical protein Bca52824_040522 [Brassica carinata]